MKKKYFEKNKFFDEESKNYIDNLKNGSNNILVRIIRNLKMNIKNNKIFQLFQNKTKNIKYK